MSLANLPTPIQALDRLSDRWGGPRIFIKRDDWTGSALSGNKVRKLEYCFGEALDVGARKVLTCGGLQSNHCRATAVASAKLGLRCVVYLRTDKHDPAPDGNHLLDVLAGAEVRFVTPEEYKQLGPTAEGYWIPEGASNEVGLWGYLNACHELKKKDKFDALFHAAGSGGTSAGLAMGFAVRGLKTELIGVNVCGDAAYFEGKIESIVRAARMRWPHLPAPAPIEIMDGFVGKGYALNRPEEWSLLREVAQTEGVFLDPAYTVKAMMGLRQAIRDGRFTKDHKVLFLHTGGIYALFPKRAEATSQHVAVLRLERVEQVAFLDRQDVPRVGLDLVALRHAGADRLAHFVARRLQAAHLLLVHRHVEVTAHGTLERLAAQVDSVLAALRDDLMEVARLRKGRQLARRGRLQRAGELDLADGDAGLLVPVQHLGAVLPSHGVVAGVEAHAQVAARKVLGAAAEIGAAGGHERVGPPVDGLVGGLEQAERLRLQAQRDGHARLALHALQRADHVHVAVRDGVDRGLEGLERQRHCRTARPCCPAWFTAASATAQRRE